MKDKFKPCPFCGNTDIPADNYYEREYYTEEEAIIMWNNRK